MNAFARLILIPCEGYRAALKYRNEEEENPGDCGANHGYIDRPPV
jgi:hypothetical protein